MAALENAGLVVETSDIVHMSPDELDLEPGLRDQGYMFTFVRHPASWYQSMWAHQMDEKWDPIDAPDWFSPKWIEFWAGFTENCRSNIFEEFVRRCVVNYPEGLVTKLFEAYTAGCSFVGKQENLIEDLQTALDRAGEKYDLARLLNTKPKNVRGQRPRRIKASQYSPDLLKLVLKTEAIAMNRYGYDKLPQSPCFDRFPDKD